MQSLSPKIGGSNCSFITVVSENYKLPPTERVELHVVVGDKNPVDFFYLVHQLLLHLKIN